MTVSEVLDTGNREDEIQIYDLHKSFGDLEVLTGITTTIHRGEVVCVIGPSGSGKSTLLRCVNLLEQPTKGRIFILNQEITDPDADVDHLRTQMGMVFQSFNLFPHLTALQNCSIALIRVLKKDPEEAQAHRAGEPGEGGPRRPRPLLPRPDVRRPAAAGGDRPCAEHGPGDDALRRAHLRARPRTGRRRARRSCATSPTAA